MLHCRLGRPASRICQAACYADRLVEEFFSLEFQSGLRTGGVKKPSGFRVQEETITETMLLRLEAVFPDVVAVETYTRAKERRTGADWFWIFDFQGTLVPVLIQAKKIEGAWDGTDSWSIKFSESQRRRLVATAREWNVGWQYCLYAPCLDGWHRDPWPCHFPWRRASYIHLLQPTQPRNGSVAYHTICRDMLPFTCWCCCADSASDTADVLGVSRETFREGENQRAELLGMAREAKSVKGSVVLRMKAERRG